MKTKKPFLSFIIPTKNRPDYLRLAIKSVLDQTDQDFELIISDNFSSKKTYNIIRSFKSNKIIYIRTKKTISMTENWENGVKKAQGKYLLIIGDDDVAKPFAVKTLKSFYFKKPFDIFYWFPEIFHYEDRISGRFLLRNKNNKPKIRDIHKIANRIQMLGGANLVSLPLIYHSAFSSKLMQKIKKVNKKYFSGKSPDVFTGFAATSFCKHFLDIGQSLTVNCRSPKSNSGSACVQYGNEINISYVKDFKPDHTGVCLNDYGKPTLKFFNTTIETIFAAKTKFPKNLKSTKFNFDAMWAFYARLTNFKEIKWILFHIYKKENLNHTIMFFLFLLLNIAIHFKNKVLYLREQKVLFEKTA